MPQRSPFAVVAPSLSLAVVANLAAGGCVRSSELFVAPAMSTCASAPAAADTPLRVVTWNIKSALLSSIDTIADDLAALAPDVLALQEVDRNTERSGDVDQAAELGARLGMDVAFAAARAEGGGDYGVALLSRLPFARAERVALPGGTAFEPRVAIDATLCRTDASSASLRMVAVHADVYPWTAEEQARFLAAHIDDSLGDGVLLAGDLNQTPSEGGPDALKQGGLFDVAAALVPDAPTFSDRRIDYVLVDDLVLEQVEDAHVDTVDHSDHRPLIVDLQGDLQAAPAQD